jgi:phytoene synthase
VEDDLKSPVLEDRVRRLLLFEASRARGFFGDARKSLPPLSRRAARPALLMGALYEKLLGKMEKGDFFWGLPRPRLGWAEMVHMYLTCLMS